MNFDKKKALEEVRAELSQVMIPGSTANLVSLGAVERIIANQGQVSLVLNLPPDLTIAKKDLENDIRRRLLGLSGIHEVQILEKMRQPAQSPAGGKGIAGQEIPGVRHTIAVASGKGGVGKSTVSVNLAAQLARIGKRVGLLDSDVYGPSIPIMLGLEGERPQLTDKEMLQPIEKHGLLTMSIGFLLDDDSPVIWRGPMVTNLLRQFLFQVQWGELDYLVLDLPPGTGDAQLTLVQSVALGGSIIVTTPQDVALLDVQRAIQMFQSVEVPILGVIENLSFFECAKCGGSTKFFSSGGGKKAATRYQVPFLGAIPLSPSYVEACDRGTPIVLAQPQSALTQTLESTAAHILEQLP